MMLNTISSVLHMASAPMLVRLWMLLSTSSSTIPSSGDTHFPSIASSADKIVSFLDEFSFRIHKDTFVVLDNATVHRNRWIKELRPIWEKRGLFIFFLPPYSPHLNIAETLWRILKGKWIKPQDYMSTDMLFYATNRALADIGKGLNIIRFLKHVA